MARAGYPSGTPVNLDDVPQPAPGPAPGAEPTDADFAVAAFRERALWLRKNMGFWAPEIFEGRWQSWIETTAVSIRDAITHTGRADG